MSSAKSNTDSAAANIRHQAEQRVLTLVRQMFELATTQPGMFAALFADLFRPYGIPPSPLHKALHDAARQAGWSLPSVNARRRQHIAAQGRKIQRDDDLAMRRVCVSYIFKQLRPSLQAKPASVGTAQAIIGRLEKLRFPRKPPMTVRTIQEDIRFMKENGNFGI
jgi:hypothetical protein